MGGYVVFENAVTSLIFFPDRNLIYEPADIRLPAETVGLKVSEKVELYSWYLPPKAGRPVLLYLHGNAGNISHRLPIAMGWAERGFGMFLLDYRGFGRSTGTIRHEQDLYDDASAAYHWLRETRGLPADSIVLYGESIGCAPSLELAKREPVGAVILMAPFTKLIDMARTVYGPIIPEALIRNFRFDNESRISSCTAPIFIMHGTDDEIVPFAMGQRLFDLARDPKEFYRLPGAHHNDLTDVAGKSYWDTPAAFVHRQTNKLAE